MCIKSSPFRGGSGWGFDRQVSVRFVSKNEICYICEFYEKTELIHNYEKHTIPQTRNFSRLFGN